MNKKPAPLNVLTGLGLVTFGCLYAYYIARHPFRRGWTWLSVLIGDGVTDLGSLVMIYRRTGDFWAALIPICSHIFTGLPMILGQELKRHWDSRHSQEILKDYNGQRK